MNYMLTTTNGSNARREWVNNCEVYTPTNVWRVSPRSLVGWAHPPLPLNITYGGKTSEVDVATNCHSGEHRDEIFVRIDHLSHDDSLAGVTDHMATRSTSLPLGHGPAYCSMASIQ
jgi:hypothetical protein